MDESDRKAFGVAITAMLETFGAEATTPQLTGYWYALSDLPLADVQQAVYESLRSSKRRPMPAELRELVEGGSGSDRAIEAWGDVLRAVPRGPYKWIDFGDSVINAAIRYLGGWPTFVSRFSTAESEKWARIDFLKTYESLAGQRVDGDACDTLPGLAAIASIDGQVCEPVPVRIGCSSERAKLSPAKNAARSAARLQSNDRPTAILKGVPE